MRLRSPVNPFYAARLSGGQRPPTVAPVMQVLDLFSGIGGFSLGLERAGMQTAAFCKIDSFCRRVLQRHWPQIPDRLERTRALGNAVVPQIPELIGRAILTWERNSFTGQRFCGTLI